MGKRGSFLWHSAATAWNSQLTCILYHGA